MGWISASGLARGSPPSGSSSTAHSNSLPLASSYAAFLASAVTVFALHARTRDGHGRRIEVPLFNALFQAFGAYAMSGEGAGNPAFSSDIWGAGCYRCGDGRCVMWATHNPRFMEALVAVGGVPEWRDLGLLDRPRLAAEPALLAELRRRVAALFATRPALAWEEALSAAGAPLALVRSPREWIESPHARAVEAVVEAEDPALGRHRQPGRPVRLSGEAQPATGSAPGAPAPAPAAQPLRQLLEGLKVVDLTQVLAGPTAARLMAELGAEVVKVNDPANPPQGYRYHLDVNRGKRTLLLDLKRPAGRDLFVRLAAGADVVLQNFARGVPERLGIGRETLMAANPRLVHGTVSAYGQEGPDGPAPWGGRRGYEPLGQAMSGMQWRFGGPDSPLMEPLAVCDYGTGLLAAFGVGLALLQRQRSGRGSAVEASLAHTGTWLQTPWLLLAGEAMPEVPGGRAALGFGPLQRFYRAADGWFFLGTRPQELAAMAAVEGLSAIGGLEGTALEAALAERFATAPLAVWRERLAALDVGLAAHRRIGDLMRDPWVVAQGLSITRDHEGVGRVTGIGPSARVAPSPPVPGRPVRPPGADGRELLAELGLGAAEIEALVRDGVVGGVGATSSEEPLALRGA